MNTLVLRPGQRTLAFSYFANGWDQPVCAGHLGDYRSATGAQDALGDLRQQLAAAAAAKRISAEPDVIALRGVFGGSVFRQPVLASPEVLRQLEELVPNAPMHTPALLALLRACAAGFPRRPVALVFETAFFVDLPEREHLYAMAPDLTHVHGVRRFGFHGILHAAAAQHVARKRRELGLETPARLLSICLEARPELAAVLGQKPLLVTSGATPLEGLPGQTTSGELDPGIVLMLASKKGWGPEQINTVLTTESGWLGLVGRTTTLAEIFGSHRPECQLARALIEHRLILACGAGMAALGGVDTLAFSGSCSGVGVGLGLWLKKKLEFAQPGIQVPINIEICPEPIERVLAETACATVLGNRPPK